MSMVRTSLGVDPELEYTDFVFGDNTEVVRVRFRLAENLHQSESIAQQNLDFIRKLYLEQSVPGEYFEQIHLATEFGSPAESSPSPSAEPDSGLQEDADKPSLQEAETPDNHAVLRNALDQLFEYLLQWINTESIPVKLVCHDDIAVATQKQVLSLHKPLTEFSIYNKKTVGSALALWSFAFAGRSQPIKPSESNAEAVNYETLSEHFSDQYLPDYKQRLIKKFETITFPNPDIEDERHILLNLAKESDSTKYELLNYQERISGMLEKHMLSVATTSENPQRNVLKKTLPETLGSSTDVGLFDIEAIDNAERIWNEINQTIARNRPRESSDEAAFEPVALFEEAALEADDDEPPMFELEARAIPTSLRPQRSRRSQGRSSQGRSSQGRSSRGRKRRSHSHSTDRQTEVASTQPAATPQHPIDSTQTVDTAVNATDQKHNDFFSLPAFARQDQSNLPSNEEKPTVTPSKNILRRSESRYLPLLAIVVVAGIYYLIR